MNKIIHSFYQIFLPCIIIILLSACINNEKDALHKDPRLVPRIVTMPRQKMLVTEMKGNPVQNSRIAYSALFKIYYKMKRKILLENPAMRVRYPQRKGTLFNEGIGIYGLTIPESVETLPERAEWAKDPDVNIQIEYWEYGDVGEILHIGPYTTLPQSYDKLRKFINKKGYEIRGPWEEEYIKTEEVGVSPNDYETILRFRVIKKE